MPHHHASSTSFVIDCSYSGLNFSTPDCRRAREMFYGKEVIGAKIDCEDPPLAPPPGKPDKWPSMRDVYFHDTTTDLWYHCCEHRARYSKFMTDAERIRRPRNSLMSMFPAELASSVA